MTELLFIRHGETVWNRQQRFQGQIDVPLKATGIWQAGRLAERLAREPIDAIYSSDLSRAFDTARAIGAVVGLEPEPHLGLRERAFGIFEGHTVDEIAVRWPDDLRHWRARDPAWVIPQGESGQQCIDRVLAALHDLVLAYAGRRLAVVAHGGVLDVAYRHARGLAWDAPRGHVMLNASINRVQGRASPLHLTIDTWGDITHLGDVRDETLT